VSAVWEAIQAVLEAYTQRIASCVEIYYIKSRMSWKLRVLRVLETSGPECFERLKSRVCWKLLIKKIHIKLVEKRKSCTGWTPWTTQTEEVAGVC